MRTGKTMGRSRFRSFTAMASPRDLELDVDKEAQAGLAMPTPNTCLKEAAIECRSSASGGWVGRRAALTRTSLALSKDESSNLALHTIPLHEIAAVTRGQSKRDSVNQLDETRDGRVVKAVGEEAASDAFHVETIAGGFNFGRIFTIRCSTTAVCEDWVELLNKTVHEALASYRRRLFLSNLQEHLRHAYTSRYVQFFVMLAILGNVATEAAHLQLQPQPDDVLLTMYHRVDVAFTLFFAAELFVNWASHVGRGFTRNLWNFFDIFIVLGSLVALNPAV